jgi:toxin FitB
VTDNYVVLDTDVASLTFKRRLTPVLLKALAGRPICITFVTYGEMTQWAEVRHWGSKNREALEHWLASVPVLPAGEEVAKIWGQIAAYARLRGRSLPQNDGWIAACCLAYELPLATLNVKDFADLVEYEGLVLITGPAE